MILQIFTVFDAAAQRYLRPFCAETIEVAIRMFRESVNTADHPFCKHPEEYVLFHVGEWNGEEGCITPLDSPHSLGLGSNYSDPERFYGKQADLPLKAVNDG